MELIWATPEIDHWKIDEWDKVLAHLSKHGFYGIEPLYTGHFSLGIEIIEKLLEKHQLHLTGLRTGGIAMRHSVFFNHHLQEVREEAVTRFTDMIRYCARFGRPRVLVGLMQGNLQPGQTVAGAENNLHTCMSECNAVAEEFGMEFDLEPVNRHEINFHNKTAEVLDFIKTFNSPNIRLLLDTYHMYIEESSITETIRSAKDHIGHIHISDSNRRIPGKGIFDFCHFFSVLRDIGYDGDITIEAEVNDVIQEIGKAADYLKEIMLL